MLFLFLGPLVRKKHASLDNGVAMAKCPGMKPSAGDLECKQMTRRKHPYSVNVVEKISYFYLILLLGYPISLYLLSSKQESR